MLTPESTEKLVCIIGVAGVFVGELVRKQAAAAYSQSFVYQLPTPSP